MKLSSSQRDRGGLCFVPLCLNNNSSVRVLSRTRPIVTNKYLKQQQRKNKRKTIFRLNDFNFSTHRIKGNCCFRPWPRPCPFWSFRWGKDEESGVSSVELPVWLWRHTAPAPCTRQTRGRDSGSECRAVTGSVRCTCPRLVPLLRVKVRTCDKGEGGWWKEKETVKCGGGGVPSMKVHVTPLQAGSQMLILDQFLRGEK